MTEHEPTVFVLEDDAGMRDSLSRLLQELRRPAEFFSTVSEFLDVFEPSRPGCLLLDLRLPGDGLELLKELSTLGCQLPVIVMSGHGDTATRERVMKNGAIAFFEKPFDNQKFVDQILQVLEPASETPGSTPLRGASAWTDGFRSTANSEDPESG